MSARVIGTKTDSTRFFLIFFFSLILGLANIVLRTYFNSDTDHSFFFVFFSFFLCAFPCIMADQGERE